MLKVPIFLSRQERLGINILALSMNSSISFVRNAGMWAKSRKDMTATILANQRMKLMSLIEYTEDLCYGALNPLSQ